MLLWEYLRLDTAEEREPISLNHVLIPNVYSETHGTNPIHYMALSHRFLTQLIVKCMDCPNQNQKETY